MNNYGHIVEQKKVQLCVELQFKAFQQQQPCQKFLRLLNRNSLYQIYSFQYPQDILKLLPELTLYSLCEPSHHNCFSKGSPIPVSAVNLCRSIDMASKHNIQCPKKVTTRNSCQTALCEDSGQSGTFLLYSKKNLKPSILSLSHQPSASSLGIKKGAILTVATLRTHL